MNAVAKPGVRPRTLAAFAVGYALLQWFFERLALSGRLIELQQWTASAANALLRGFGLRTVISSTTVVTDRGIVTVDGVCMPIVAAAVGVALLMFLTRVPIGTRVILAAALLPALMIASMLRVALVAALMHSGSGAVEFVHGTVTPFLLVAVSFSFWMAAIWLGRHAEA